VSSSSEKRNNFGQILTFEGFLYLPPFTDESKIWCARAYLWSMLTCRISSQSVYSAKNANFTILSTSAFCGVASWRLSEKVEYGCTTTNLPWSNGIQIISVSLHGEIMCTNSGVQKHDWQTDKLETVISSGSVCCVAHTAQKNAEISQFQPNFHNLHGLLCPSPFTDPGHIW